MLAHYVMTGLSGGLAGPLFGGAETTALTRYLFAQIRIRQWQMRHAGPRALSLRSNVTRLFLMR